MVVLLRVTLIILSFAYFTALWTASGTAVALARAIPTLPAPSPTATIALNDKFLPPFTVLDTLLIFITFSTKENSSLSLFLLGLEFLLFWLFR